MKTLKANFLVKDNGLVRVGNPNTPEIVRVDELVLVSDTTSEAKPVLARVRNINSIGTMWVEIYPDNEPPFKTIAVDSEGWTFQRVCMAPGGSWLSHESVNRRWVEISNKVTIIRFGN